ncbi:prevent-host-death family protein [Streptomyces rubiginosohelvolus]
MSKEPQEHAETEAAQALARYQARRASGAAETVPHDEVRARLGLERR